MSRRSPTLVGKRNEDLALLRSRLKGGHVDLRKVASRYTVRVSSRDIYMWDELWTGSGE